MNEEDGKMRMIEEGRTEDWEMGRKRRMGEKEEGDERLGWKVDEMIEEWKSIVYNNNII